MIPRLSMDAVRDTPGRNSSERPDGVPIDMLILHTGDGGSGGSAHYVVAWDGSIARIVDEAMRATHAGDGFWRGNAGLDGRSIGIDIAASPRGGRRFPALQMAAVCELCLSVIARHPIPPRNVVGRGDVAYDEPDTGEPFDWPGLATNGVGLWPDVPDAGDEEIGDTAAVRADLIAIGYHVGEGDTALAGAVRAAQRHWRPELVTGLADAGTAARLAALRAMADTGY